MPSIRFNRNILRLKPLLGIRGRLAVLALILVAPLMLERARSLETTRTRQIAAASHEFIDLARRSADAQREMMLSVETLLKSTAYVRAAAGDGARSCDLLRASLPQHLPWIRNVMAAGPDGRIQCATNNFYVGVDFSDRPYIEQAQETHDFVLSDFLLVKPERASVVMAAYPVSAITHRPDDVILASVNLEWMSKIMDDLSGRRGITAVMVDSTGTVLAAPSDQVSLIGRSLDTLPLLSAAAAKFAMSSNNNEGAMPFEAADGSRHVINFSRIGETGSRLIVNIDQTRVTAAIDHDIRNAYFQAGLVCLIVLLGALCAAEILIVRPINMLAATARRFGQGEWSARAATARLPAEFMPLATAFNAMATTLGERERELLSTNDELTVMASMDMVSGLANRRGFQSRLEFEWMKAWQNQTELAILMIDVDHFKLYNDTYGHPEGDACLARLGKALTEIANSTMGFAGRYGGEEFCLLIPNAGMQRAVMIGDSVRSAVMDLALPHTTSSYQCVTVSVGVACTQPNDQHAPAELIEAADTALYAAKRRGRNAVVAHGFVQMVETVTDVAKDVAKAG